MNYTNGAVLGASTTATTLLALTGSSDKTTIFLGVLFASFSLLFLAAILSANKKTKFH